MGSYEQMRDLLLPLGLYRLDGTTRVDAELRAYAAGFALLEERLAAMRRNAFLESADDGGLRRWETLYGAEDSGLSVEERRRALARRAAQRQGVWDRAAFFAALGQAGFAGTVEEYPQQYRIHLRFSGGASLTGIGPVLRAVYRLAPAQLQCTADLPAPDWDALDAYALRWDAWDHTQLRWELLEEQ